MTTHTLGVIGGGNMAEALLRGAIKGNVLRAGEIVVSEPLPARREAMAALGLAVTDDNAAAAACEHVLLAVKPQMMAGVLAQIAPVMRSDALVISIAAGISTARIDSLLGGRGRIVRVMPNTPMMVGEGMSGLAAGPRATDADLLWTRRLTDASGKSVVLAEDQIDALTAVSGSGPAYFFYVIEAMVAAGVAEGLDEPTALLLASQTCAGAAALLAGSGESPQVLRARVTSPGGTTQRAIETLDAANVRAAFTSAVRAAAARSRELGR